MLKSLCFLFLHVIFLLSLAINAQVNDNNMPVIKSIEAKEKEQVLKAYDILNSGDETAYAIGHDLLKTTQTHFAKINAHLFLAYYFRSRQLNDSSNFYVNTYLKLNIVGSDTLIFKRKTVAYNLLAINNKNKGLLEESRKWHQRGIALATKYKYEEYYFTHLHGLANTYMDMGDSGQALQLFEECLAYKIDPEITMGSYINIGEIHARNNDFETSNSYLKKGLELAEKHNRKNATAVIMQQLASNSQDLGKLDEAISLYYKVIAIASEHKFYKEKLMAYKNIGSVFIDSKKYKDAELIYSSALNDAIELGYLDQQLDIYDNLRNIAINQSNYKNAHHFSSQYFKIKDSIGKLQKDKEIDELEVKYQTLQREKEIGVLQIENTNRNLKLANQEEAIRNLKLQQEIEKKENENKLLSIQNTTDKTINENALLKKNQEIKEAQFLIQQAETIRQKEIRNMILYAFIIFLIPLVGLLYIYYQKLKTQSELNKKQEEVSSQKIFSLIKDQELKLVKASIKGQNKERERIAQELHDSIGGNLAGIKLQLNNSDNSNLIAINRQIDDTYKQVRDLSHNLIPKKFSENNFCDILEEYLNNIIKGSNMSSCFNAYPRKKIDILSENLQIETFKIIQELITNTIKHADATVIELQLNLVDNVLGILFEDNGKGFIVEKSSNGIGYRNMKNRLQKISGTLYIDSRLKRGTIINIEIPNLTYASK